MNKVNILGTEYTVGTDETLVEKGRAGETDLCQKTIHVLPLDMLFKDSTNVDSKKICREETARHEVVHAFFRESGMTEWCYNEDLVEWIAQQVPKINKATEDVINSLKEADGE